MKNFIKSILPTMIVACLLGFVSCSDMDDYLKYTDGQSILYTGKVEAAVFRSGNERVLFQGLLPADPKVTKVGIYWNNRKDQLEIDVVRTPGVDLVEASIPLAEGRYYFEVITYDAKGTPSIPINMSGVSYGDNYKLTLYNRAIKKAEKMGNDVVIDWYNGDDTSPFVKIDYTDAEGKEHIVKAPTQDKKTILPNYKSMSKFRMQAYYLPDEFAIDTFKVDPVYVTVNEDLTHFFKNPGNPFYRSDNGDGKWGIVKDWQYTSNIINQNGSTAGGWSTDSGGVIHFESKDWGGDGVTNGKIFQTISLPAGNYTTEFYSDGGGSSDFTGRFMVTEGTALPDVDRSDDAIAVHTWDKDFMGGTHTLNFTLAEDKTITVGWAVSFGSSTWMHVNYIKLKRLAE